MESNSAGLYVFFEPSYQTQIQTGLGMCKLVQQRGFRNVYIGSNYDKELQRFGVMALVYEPEVLAFGYLAASSLKNIVNICLILDTLLGFEANNFRIIYRIEADDMQSSNETMKMFVLIDADTTRFMLRDHAYDMLVANKYRKVSFKGKVIFPPLFSCNRVIIILEVCGFSPTGVQQISRYYKGGMRPKQIDFSRVSKSIGTIDYHSFISKPKSKAEARIFAAEKHKEAERKRRSRINEQYDSLRTKLPNLVKMDKASVLAETVRYVRELKKTVTKLKAVRRIGDTEFIFPGGENKLRVVYCQGEGGLAKVILSCEDKLTLISEVTRALGSVKGKVIRAEMVTVGGRTQIVLWIQGLSGNEELKTLERALKPVLERPFSMMSRSSRLMQSKCCTGHEISIETEF
ncbi:uncharacterized protein LOC119993449 [Tripterygium wilfordii]|uniref:uncharacterized protein LOC119993449 n=1 Tax=Tripterygium wilfordii TaxID=458696 RepID=UPI0018F84553|nr:uncharacterized protein LOC119993449 [Tripterygium wilfordii]